MGESSFTQRLEQRKRELEKSSQSAKHRLGPWKLALGELSVKVKRWLDVPIKKGLVEVIMFEKTIQEEQTGQYEVKGLVVSLGGRRVRFDPIATYVVGAFGRVDMIGSAAKFILIREKNDGHWSLMNPNNPKELHPLTKDVFEKTLLEALG